MMRTGQQAFFLTGLLALAAAIAQADAPRAATEVRAFRSADADGDGQLDPPEFRVFVITLAEDGQATAKRIRHFGAYRLAFGVADSDRDGQITPDELRDAERDGLTGRN